MDIPAGEHAMTVQGTATQATQPAVRGPAGAIRGLWHRLRGRLRETIPTSAVGMERAIVLAIAGLRIGTVIQMAPALGAGLTLSSRPGLYGLCWGVAAVMAVAVSVTSLVRGKVIGARVFAVDAVIAVVLLLLGDLCVPTDMRVGTWVGFQPAYALSVGATGAVIRARWAWVGALVGIVLADLYFRAPQAVETGTSTQIGNALTYVVLVAVARVAVRYMRRVAADGDRARADAAELGRREEERRAQLAIHNGAALMRLLADPDLDEGVRAVVQREADLEARRMRSYLQGQRDRAAAAGGRTALVAQLEQVASRFGDLPLSTALDLAAGVMLDADLAAALDHALAALLMNVRDHADAQRVVIHADTTDDGDGGTRWTVTLHDDGRGFDTDPESWGVGLREVVHGQLQRHGVDVELTSRPGLGSTVVLSAVVAREVEVRRG